MDAWEYPDIGDEIIIQDAARTRVKRLWVCGAKPGVLYPSPTGTSNEVLAAIKHSAASFLVAESEGWIVGINIGTWDVWCGDVYRLAVSPEVRRQGVAHMLVDAAEKRIAGQGRHRITALVEKNHP